MAAKWFADRMVCTDCNNYCTDCSNASLCVPQWNQITNNTTNAMRKKNCSSQDSLLLSSVLIYYPRFLFFQTKTASSSEKIPACSVITVLLFKCRVEGISPLTFEALELHHSPRHVLNRHGRARACLRRRVEHISAQESAKQFKKEVSRLECTRHAPASSHASARPRRQGYQPTRTGAVNDHWRNQTSAVPVLRGAFLWACLLPAAGTLATASQAHDNLWLGAKQHHSAARSRHAIHPVRAVRGFGHEKQDLVIIYIKSRITVAYGRFTLRLEACPKGVCCAAVLTCPRGDEVEYAACSRLSAAAGCLQDFSAPAPRLRLGNPVFCRRTAHGQLSCTHIHGCWYSMRHTC